MSEPAATLIDFEVHGPVYSATIRANSVLSAGNIAEFGAELLQYIARNPNLNLIINFEHVDYLSSAVLNELLRAERAIGESGGHLRLCAVSPTILEIFQITNLDKKFTIHADGLDEDIKRFRRALAVEKQEAAWEEIA